MAQEHQGLSAARHHLEGRCSCARLLVEPRGHRASPGRSGHQVRPPSPSTTTVIDVSPLPGPAARHVVDVEPGIADDGFDECCDLVTVWRHDFLPCPAVYAVHAQRCARCTTGSRRWHDCRRAFPVPPRPAAPPPAAVAVPLGRQRLTACSREPSHEEVLLGQMAPLASAATALGQCCPPPGDHPAASECRPRPDRHHPRPTRGAVARGNPAAAPGLRVADHHTSESASPSGSPSGPTTGPVSDGSLDAFRKTLADDACCPDGRHRRQRFRPGSTALDLGVGRQPDGTAVMTVVDALRAAIRAEDSAIFTYGVMTAFTRNDGRGRSRHRRPPSPAQCSRRGTGQPAGSGPAPAAGTGCRKR